VNVTDSPTRPPWYETNPARLQWELDEFARHGLQAAVATDDGRLVVVTQLTFRDEAVPLRVVYSYEHPEMPPEVMGSRLLLERHQDPLELNYCLLEDPERDWNPWDSAGRLVGKDLRRLFRDAENGPAAVAAGEADMPEPVSSQFAYDSGLTVLVPDPFFNSAVPAASGSVALIPCHTDGLWILARAEGIGEADAELLRVFAGDAKPENRAGWVSLDRPPVPTQSRDELVASAASARPELFERLDRRLNSKKRLGQLEAWLGLTFLEEGPTRGQTRRTWVFAKVKRTPESTHVVRLARAQGLTRQERDRRIPELAGLEAARFLLVGAGSLGAPVALELVKAGAGKVDIVDNDFYDVNNSVRHVLDLRHAGAPKADALASDCRRKNPFASVDGHLFTVGRGPGEAQELAALVGGADVVIDTTGSLSVARVLMRQCFEARRPLVVSGLTSSSYGAEILVALPGGPCLDCFLTAQRQGLIPEPPAGVPSAVTPVGCRHPAFSGAGFEATEAGAVIARTVIRLSGKTAYPGLSFNWVVMSFRADPHYLDGTADRHPDCPSALHSAPHGLAG
jgi:molybdopterin/thiamine biosynthesis adenylyltransferase